MATQRARRGGNLGQSFTFGGRQPPAVGAILVAMLVATVAAWLSPGFRGAVSLFPDAILYGQVWRLVSWPFVAPDPITLFFSGLLVWQFGPQLAYAWGERRFLLTFLGLAVTASVVTTLVGAAWAGANLPYLGAWPVVTALIVMWGLMYSDRQLSWWGILQLTGKQTALIVVAGTVLWSLFAGLGPFVPHFTAIGLGWALATGLGTRGVKRSWLGAKDAWLEWRLRRRSRHLKVVSRKNGADDRPRYMN
jgi:membrane associated rhomboid family serine protease